MATEKQKQKMKEWYQKNKEMKRRYNKRHYETDLRNKKFHPNKARESKLGSNNPNWNPNREELSLTGIRGWLQRNLEQKACEICGSNESEVHHIDGNPWNNDSKNLKWLCRKHHMEEDGRLNALILRNRRCD